MNFIRYPFFVVNTIFMVFGILIMSLGILLLTNYSSLEQMFHLNIAKSLNSNDTMNVALVLLKSPVASKWLTGVRDPISYLLISFGAGYFTLSFIGCCGSVKDSRGIMVVYAVLLGIIIALQIIGVVLYVNYKPELKAELVNAIHSQYKSEEMQQFTQFEFILDLVMIHYKCCGVNNEKDFNKVYSQSYLVSFLSMDPRGQGNDSPILDAGNFIGSSAGESETNGENGIRERTITQGKSQEKTEKEKNGSSGVKRESLERQVPVSCCKLNITNADAIKMLSYIYQKQEDKLQLLDYAIDRNCVTKPDEVNAHVGDSQGCFDKIQVELWTYLLIGLIVVGVFQLCGIVLAVFIFKSAYYACLG